MRREISKKHWGIACAIGVFGVMASAVLWLMSHTFSWPLMVLVFTFVGVWSVRDHALSFGDLKDE